jgi:hypothetical protein
MLVSVSVCSKQTEISVPVFHLQNSMETWKHGDMEHRQGDMETWRNGDMGDLETWRHGHKDIKRKGKQNHR